MKNEKISKDTLIAFLVMVVFLYLIPGILYFFNPGFSFKSLAIAFVFIQLILSDSFLEKYNVLRPNRLRIDSYRIITTNLTIGFSILQLIAPHIAHSSERVNNWVIHNFPTSLPSIISQPFFSKFMLFLFFWAFSEFLAFLLIYVEKKVADLMKKQNNF